MAAKSVLSPSNDATIVTTTVVLRQINVPMHDDGSHADVLANDGTFGAVFEALVPGQYTAQSIFKGKTVDGIAFERSAEHSFHVISPYITLTGMTRIVVLLPKILCFGRSHHHLLFLLYLAYEGLGAVEYDKENAVFKFHLDVDASEVPAHDTTVKAYAEVWGTDTTGYEYAPVAWMQAMVDPHKNSAGETIISLQLHENWAHKVHFLMDSFSNRRLT